MNVHPRQGIPLRADPTALDAWAVGVFTRAAITLASTKLDPSIRPAEFATKRWGTDESRAVDWMVRAASSAAMTTVPGWAAELARVSHIFVSSLVPVSAGADLLRHGLQLSFDGAASISLPLIQPGTATFLREGAAIPVRQFTTQAGATLTPCTLKTITTLTREMLESSNAEAIIRTALAESVGPALDLALFSQSAATPDAPAGILAGVAPLTPSTATPLSDAMMADLSTLIGAVARVAGNSEVCIVAAPEQAVAIRLMAEVDDYPTMASATLAKGTVIAVAAAALASVLEGAPQIETSRQVALAMDDATPGAPNSGKTLSTFQTDSVALKMRMPAAWTLRAPLNSVAWMSGVSW